VLLREMQIQNPTAVMIGRSPRTTSQGAPTPGTAALPRIPTSSPAPAHADAPAPLKLVIAPAGLQRRHDLDGAAHWRADETSRALPERGDSPPRHCGGTPNGLLRAASQPRSPALPFTAACRGAASWLRCRLVARSMHV